ncbi:MAG: hypothetical protein LBU17_05150 [Treponema sp.]|jgi:hypothetical protein|nr:hypothetical protein [Treponema sp.]
MTQIAIDDRLITRARALLDGKGFTDTEIVNAALDRWVDDKENSRELDIFIKECRGNKNVSAAHVDTLLRYLDVREVVTTDVVILEVLQGFRICSQIT